jgi:hypothetical protein
MQPVRCGPRIMQSGHKTSRGCGTITRHFLLLNTNTRAPAKVQTLASSRCFHSLVHTENYFQQCKQAFFTVAYSCGAAAHCTAGTQIMSLTLRRITCQLQIRYGTSHPLYVWAGIATGYGLDDRMIGVRFPAEVGNFSLRHRVQNGSGAHPASYPMDTRGSFPGGKAAGAWSWPRTSICCRCQRMRGAIPPLPQYVFMAWYLLSTGTTLHFTFTIRCMHISAT